MFATAPVFDHNALPAPVIDIPGDYGLWVQAVIENEPLQTDPRPVLTSGEDLTIKEMLDTLEKSEVFLRRLCSTALTLHLQRLGSKSSAKSTPRQKLPTLKALRGCPSISLMILLICGTIFSSTDVSSRLLSPRLTLQLIAECRR